jgi:hypothetical protein
MFLLFSMVHYHLASGLASSIHGTMNIHVSRTEVRISANIEKAAKARTGKVLNLFYKSRQCGIIIPVRGSL